MHVAGEAQFGELIGKVPAEAPAFSHPIEFFPGEAQVFEELQHLLEPGRHQKIAVPRQPPDKKLEDGDIVHPLREVRLQHGELVEVGEQGTFPGFDHVPRAARVMGFAPRCCISASALGPSSGFILTARMASDSRYTS